MPDVSTEFRFFGNELSHSAVDLLSFLCSFPFNFTVSSLFTTFACSLSLDGFVFCISALELVLSLDLSNATFS